MGNHQNGNAGNIYDNSSTGRDEGNELSDNVQISAISGRLNNMRTSTGLVLSCSFPSIPVKYVMVHRRDNTLLRQVWERDWPKVTKTLSMGPKEAYFMTNDTHRTALHLAMFNHGCPTRVMTMLLNANPHAAILRDKLEFTPLHYAAHFGIGAKGCIDQLCHAILLVESLLIGRKSSEIRIIGSENKSHRSGVATLLASPLFHACSRKNASFEALDILISASEHQQRQQSHGWIAPRTGGETWFCDWDKCNLVDDHCSTSASQTLSLDENLSPLRALWDRFQKDSENEAVKDDQITRRVLRLQILRADREGTFSGRIISTCKSSNGEASASIRDEDSLEQLTNGYIDLAESSLPNIWKKIVLLLLVGMRRSSYEDKTYLPLVHAVAALADPLSGLLELVLSFFPEQASERDCQGFLPLHHALMANRHRKLISQHSTKDNEQHFDIEFESSLKSLLRVNPAGAKELDPERKLPLIRAIELQIPWENGIRDIVMCFPEALHARDLQTCLFPFMIAATKNGGIDVIYRLLRAAPENIKQEYNMVL
eukprot:scaffold13625_cov48-Attheya_sp.AAC.1